MWKKSNNIHSFHFFNWIRKFEYKFLQLYADYKLQSNLRFQLCQIFRFTGIFIFFLRNYNQRDEKKSSGKEMRLVIVVGLLAVTVIALIVALTLQMAVFRKEEYKEMCQSEECIKTGIRHLALFFNSLQEEIVYTIPNFFI